MNILKRIIINTSAQVFGRFFSFILSFISVYLLTRYLGASGYGIYSLVFSYLSFFTIFSDMGLSLIVVRELSKKTSVKFDDISNFFSVKLILTISSIILSLGILIFMPYSFEAKLSILIASIGVGIGGLTSFGSSILQARLRMDLVTLTDLITKIITVTLICVFIMMNQSLYLIVSTVLIGNLFGILLTTLFVKRIVGISGYFKIVITKKIIKEGLLMGLLTLVAYSYFKADTIVLSLYRSSQEVGIYSLAYKIIENIIMFWGLYMATTYPLFSIFVANNKRKYNNLFIKTMILGLFFSLICLTIGFTQSELVVKIFGGEKFISSIIPLKILLLSIPFLVVNNVFYSAFLSKIKVGRVIVCLSISLLFNLVFNIIYIPKFGYIAASYITVATEVLLFFLYLGTYRFFHEKS